MEQTCRTQDDQRNRTSGNPLGGRGRGLCFTGKLQRATPGKFDEHRHKCMLGRIHHLIFDCPDPRSLARFYSELLGQPITHHSEDFVVVAESDTKSGLAFQLAPVHPATDAPGHHGREHRRSRRPPLLPHQAPLSNWPLTPDECADAVSLGNGHRIRVRVTKVIPLLGSRQACRWHERWVGRASL